MTPTTTTVTLQLPEPPSQAGRQGWRSKWRKVHDYKRDAWAAACSQVPPSTDPLDNVVLHAHYRLWNLRDRPNLYGDLKPVLDALKQMPAPADKLKWKGGVWTLRGYFRDDEAVTFGRISQEVDRDNRGVTVVLEAVS